MTDNNLNQHELLTPQELEALDGVYFAEPEERPYLTFDALREASRQRMRDQRAKAVDALETGKLETSPPITNSDRG